MGLKYTLKLFNISIQSDWLSPDCGFVTLGSAFRGQYFRKSLLELELGWILPPDIGVCPARGVA